MASSIVGVDIGTGSVKLSFRDGGVVRLVSKPLPENIIGENDVVAPANLLTDNFFAVVCATCTTDETVFTPHSSVVYSGTDATIALP